ncbi:hypothetical protein COLO4_02339 [Corchorus olitorius]|uniref:Uncharacterized protein n=1 Tax=Corchorus olitorius TaxID=93759 RepID=A0A1R3L155_9ROSI|nr:hypothetical protein COLO4_02339 [Corchorus olitorius]
MAMHLCVRLLETIQHQHANPNTDCTIRHIKCGPGPLLIIKQQKIHDVAQRQPQINHHRRSQRRHRGKKTMLPATGIRQKAECRTSVVIAHQVKKTCHRQMLAIHKRLLNHMLGVQIERDHDRAQH